MSPYRRCEGCDRCVTRSSEGDTCQRCGQTDIIHEPEQRAGAPCHEGGSLEDDRDNRPLPRDPAERAKVPRELSEAILEAVESAYENPTEQTVLGEEVAQ